MPVEVMSLITFTIIIIGLGIFIAVFGDFEDDEQKEKELKELHYDDPAKEERYLEFKEKYEFQERLRKEKKIKMNTNCIIIIEKVEKASSD